MERRVRVAHAVAVALCAAAAVLHQTWELWNWYIEDAAISFAYARNLSNGLGLVPWSGGERIEGYSNPAWVALLGLLEWLGADAMLASKWVSAVLAAATVGVVYLLARECVPARWREVPLLACALLAADPQFAIWGACGLENPLFSFLLASALTRSLVESRTGGRPWSALLWFLLAITRPEAIAYVAVGGLLAVFAQRRSALRVAGWIATFAVPFALYHAARYSYFAWPFPMTYYAKLETKDPNVLRWIPNAGWKYAKDWGVQTWRALLVLAWIPGVVGMERWRSVASVSALGALGAAFLYPEQKRWLWPFGLAFLLAVAWRLAERSGRARWIQGGLVAAFCAAVALAAALNLHPAAGPFHRPAWWNPAPPYLVLAVLAGVAFLGVGTEGWRGRVACWLSACLSLGFAVQALGDWMKGFRWMSLLSVPGAVLAAVGCAVVGDALLRWLRPAPTTFWRDAFARGAAGAVGVSVLIACAAGGATYTHSFADKPETGPKMVKARVSYLNNVIDRIKLDERVRDLDVDQGAHLWWTRWQMYDIAGLIDVPFAIHRFDRNFVPKYVFDEIKPHFAHLHGNWASSSRILTYPQWKASYVEIPGYPASGGQLHVGNHVRRDLLLTRESPFPAEQAVELAGDVTFAGYEIPSPEVALGGAFRIHVGLAIRKRMADNQNFRVLVFASDGAGHVASWDAAPTYDWVRPADWRLDEVAVGKYDLRLPADLPRGTYDVGFVILGPDGVLAPAAPRAEAPVMATGELRYAGVLRVVDGADAKTAAEADRAAALAAAGEVRCADAERAWFEARMHQVHEKAWTNEHRKPMARALARCWIGAARVAETPEEAVDAVRRARGWDWYDDEVLAFGAKLGAQRHAAGEIARAGEDWEAAYRGFADAVAVDPSRSWSRRYAEEMRIKWLKIDPEAFKRQKIERQQRGKNPVPRVPAKRPTPPRPAP